MPSIAWGGIVGCGSVVVGWLLGELSIHLRWKRQREDRDRER